MFLLIFFPLNVHASFNAVSVLVNYGIREGDLNNIINKYPELTNLDLAAERNYLPPEESNSSLVELKLYSEKNNDAYIISKSDEGTDVEKIEMHYEVGVKSFNGIIHHTLFDSIIHQMNSPNVASQINEIFQDELASSKGPSKNAFYHFEIEQYFDHDQFIKYGNILSATLIVGKAISKKIYQLNPEKKIWELSPENSNNSEKPFYLPINNLRVTSLFQLNRHHPVTKKFQPHNGIDFGAPSGSPVFPASAGKIITIAKTRSKGKYITILHDNGYQTTYIHLKKIEKGLKIGMKVKLEDRIGEVGRTGFATGAHLHFGVIKDGYFVNPIFLLKHFSYLQRNLHEITEANIDEKNIINGKVPEEDDFD